MNFRSALSLSDMPMSNARGTLFSMRPNLLRRLLLAFLVIAATESVSACAEETTSTKATVKPPAKTAPAFRTAILTGKVVWFNKVLKHEFGISTESDAAERTLALQTTKGELIPIIEDLRGTSFRTDKRLRDRPVELYVRRYQRHPAIQVLRIFELQGKKKFEVDYWCDVCAIVMFEQGYCACCQDNNRIRRRLVTNGVTAERD